MRTTAILFALLLAGCVKSDANIYRGGLFGQNVTGNEVGVTVTNVWKQSDAFPLAEKHCRQFNRAARFNRMEGYSASFDCVKID